MDYYDLPHVSNSNLKALRARINAIENGNPEAYKFGSLVDQLITEPEKDISPSYALDVINKAAKMRDAALSQKTIKLLVANIKFQYIVIRESFKIGDITLRMKCKFDGIHWAFSLGVDIKSTACTTLKAFIESIFHFDYDQQAALYMDLAKIDRFWIIGISKCKKPKVYNFVVIRGDKTYLSGLNKYTYLAGKWYRYML